MELADRNEKYKEENVNRWIRQKDQRSFTDLFLEMD
jgi:hypothetical protein